MQVTACAHFFNVALLKGAALSFFGENTGAGMSEQACDTPYKAALERSGMR